MKKLLQHSKIHEIHKSFLSRKFLAIQYKECSVSSIDSLAVGIKTGSTYCNSLWQGVDVTIHCAVHDWMDGPSHIY